MDFSCTANGDLAIVANRGTAGSATVSLYVYDVTDIEDNVLKKIDFSTKGTIVYKTPTLDERITNLQDGLWLKGKLACGIGDSLTANWANGGFYRNYVKNALGLTDYTDCGVSGSLISGASGMSSDTRINALALDADIVSVFGGTNDVDQGYYEEHPSSAYEGWGDMSKTNCNVKTFVGAYNVLLSKIYYKYLLSEGFYEDIDYSGITRSSEKKDIVLICITPIVRFDSSENKLGTVCEKVRQVAEMWNLPCVDLRSNIGINNMNKALFWSHQSSPDWLHPNQEAHKRIANLVITKLKEIAMYYSEM